MRLKIRVYWEATPCHWIKCLPTFRNLHLQRMESETQGHIPEDLGNIKSTIWNPDIATGSQSREGVGSSRGTAPFILSLGTRCKSVVNITHRALYPKQRIPVLIKQEGVWVGGFWEEKNILSLHRIQTPGRPVRTLADIPAPHKYSVGPKNKQQNQVKKNRISIFQML